METEGSATAKEAGLNYFDLLATGVVSAVVSFVCLFVAAFFFEALTTEFVLLFLAMSLVLGGLAFKGKQLSLTAWLVAGIASVLCFTIIGYFARPLLGIVVLSMYGYVKQLAAGGVLAFLAELAGAWSAKNLLKI